MNPPPDDNRKPRFDDDLLEECFYRLDGQTDPSRVNFRYVVALLLIRRKRLKFGPHRTLWSTRNPPLVKVRFPMLTPVD